MALYSEDIYNHHTFPLNLEECITACVLYNSKIRTYFPISTLDLTVGAYPNFLMTPNSGFIGRRSVSPLHLPSKLGGRYYSL